MWLANYLQFRSEQSAGAEESPKNSVECLYKWSAFSGLRTGILKGASSVLSTIQEDYMEKFSALPENILTRAMMVIGLIIGPIAPIPMLVVDFAVLLSMLVVFLAGWVTGGALSIICAGLAWICGGGNAAESAFTKGTEITEDLTFFVLNILRIPAGLINVVGLIPSFVLELITELVNDAALSIATCLYKCELGPRASMHMPRAAEYTVPPARDIESQTTQHRHVPSKEQANVATPLVPLAAEAQIPLAERAPTVEVVRREPPVLAFRSGQQAADAGAGEVLSDVARQSIGGALTLARS